MRILVTGGTGYIGEHLIPKLLNDGHEVRLLVRNVEKAKKLFNDSCEYFVSDITDRESLKGCCENIDIVYHMVAKVGNELPNENTMNAFRKVNVEGTKNIVEECKKSNIKKFVFVSSIAAMGIINDIPISEKSECNPYLPYQITKKEAEDYLLEEYENNGFPIIILRPTKVYGVGEHESSFLSYAKLCKKHVFIRIGMKESYISNIYITDFIKALLCALKNGENGEIYIITSKDSISLKNVGKVIGATLGKRIINIIIPSKLLIFFANIEERIFIKLSKKPIVTRKNIEALSIDRVYDVTKAQKELKFCAEVSMENGIEKTVKWYKKSKLL